MAIIQGTDGNDVLTGGIDDARIIGSAGDDILSGGGGNNTVDYSDLSKPITIFQRVLSNRLVQADLANTLMSNAQYFRRLQTQKRRSALSKVSLNVVRNVVMSPTIVMKNGKVFMVTGSLIGSIITTTVL